MTTRIAIIWLSLAILACSQEGLEDVCSNACECEGCDAAGENRCLDDHEVRQTAVQNGCEEAYDEWLNCVAKRGECQSGQYDIGACQVEENDIQGCVCIGLFHTSPRVGQCLI